MRRATLVTCLISTLSAPVTGQVQAAQQSYPDIPRLVASARSTVVLLKAFDRQGKVIGLGSGFRIAGGRFVTNAHVVAGASRVEIFDDGGTLLGIARYAEMLSTTVDLAILPSVGARAPALSLASAPPPVGEQVIVIGAPEGLTNTVSDGIVSAIRKVETRQLLQITAPISPGSSGGPVLNKRGEVVGVSVSILREGQNLNFAVPVAEVAALVASQPGQFEFPPALDRFERGSSGRERSERATAKPLPPLLSVGSDVHASIVAEDRLANGFYVDYYRLTGSDGTSVSISLESDDFDPVLGVYRIVGDSVVMVTGDVNAAAGRDAKANLTLFGDIMYFIGVSSAPRSRSKLGSYNLRIGTAQTASSGSAAPAGEGQSRWLPVGDSRDSRIEFDRTSVTSSGPQTYLAWQRATHGTPYKDRIGDTADVTMIQYEVSCGDHRYRIRAATKYFQGRVVRNSTFAAGPWESLVPESVAEISSKAVCSYARAYGK